MFEVTHKLFWRVIGQLFFQHTCWFHSYISSDKKTVSGNENVPTYWFI